MPLSASIGLIWHPTLASPISIRTERYWSYSMILHSFDFSHAPTRGFWAPCLHVCMSAGRFSSPPISIFEKTKEGHGSMSMLHWGARLIGASPWLLGHSQYSRNGEAMSCLNRKVLTICDAVQYCPLPLTQRERIAHSNVESQCTMKPYAGIPDLSI